jgi:plastocyanin
LHAYVAFESTNRTLVAPSGDAQESRPCIKRKRRVGNQSQGGRLMPNQLQIKITKVAAVVTFSPNPQPAVAMDQIFWTNNDDTPHWPGLLNGDGTINTTFFMPNQIAGNGDTSPIFAPSTAITYQYVCSLHPNEKGTIVVS